MKPTRTWILIADGSEARVFESLGPRSALMAVEDMTFAQDLPPNRELESDRPGRSQESANPTRHAIQSRSDPHRELKRQLAREVADKLEDCLRNGRFDRLAVVAAPVVLGDIREALSEQLKAAVTAELAKDLVKVPLSDLPAHLEPVR
ncbi:MAG TPA: host attachment protein [Hyphomicrobiaceae bacterium]|nr:host attachment protein [Hyphomicrobiaceae bacterium]